MKFKNAKHRNSFNLTTVEFEDFELQSIYAALKNAGNWATANDIAKVMEKSNAKIKSRVYDT
jgi:prophage antirepressor-like protein